MTIPNRFIKLFVGALAVAMVLGTVRVQAESIEQVVTVLRVKGGARYCTDGSKRNWITLKKNDVLKPGALVQTAEDGQVDVLLGERQLSSASPLDESSGSSSGPSSGPMTYKQDSGPKANVIHIFPSSVLAVDKLTLDRTGMDEVTETQLDLQAGQIMGNVKKLSNASRYEVKVPNGVAGIRGTIYLLRANGTVYVLRGSVVISYVDKGGTLHTQVVQAGYFLKVDVDGAPVVQRYRPNDIPDGRIFFGPQTVVVPPHGRNPIVERISPD